MATLSASAPSLPAAHAERRSRIVSPLIVSFATATALLGLAALLMLTPWSVHLALGFGAADVTFGAGQEVISRLSDATVHDLVFGGDFRVIGPDGGHLYTADEVAHLRDARSLLYGFLGLAAMCALVVLVMVPRSRPRVDLTHAVGRGGLGLAIGVMVLVLVGLVAFQPAFELFHRIFFPGGNWAFDPTSSNLVRLYPLGFWTAATAMLGGVALGLGLLAWSLARIAVPLGMDR